MKTSPLLLGALCALLVGCGQLRERLGLDRSLEAPKPTPSAVTYCKGPSLKGVQLVGSNPPAQKSFQEFLTGLADPELLDFREKALVWALLQMNLRPDLASPTARLQFVWRSSSGQSSYRDFLAKDDATESFPFLWGLHHFITGHPKKRPLLWYARLIDQKFQGTLVAGKTLEERLRLVEKGIAANPKLRRHFFRGDELVQESERLARLPFTQVVQQWEKSKSAQVRENSKLYSYRKTPQLDVSCNYDFSLYDNSIFLIDREDNQGHFFGITQGNEAFFAAASQATDGTKELFDVALLAGSSKVRSNAICLIETSQGLIWLAANQSRDPGQHVYHLFRYGILKAETPADIERLIGRSRHMFLSDPLRLIIESRRSHHGQLQELLKLSVPIYHADAIGNVWAWANFSKAGGQFFIDDRNPGALFCSP